jgi:uncharacterized caspase-like protein
MPDTALVIGIDGYKPKPWRLGGAVRDALDFSRWLTTAGGVLPANLLLLLSPAAGTTEPDPPAGAALLGKATSSRWRKTLVNLQKASTGGDRLWIYYAGHGASVRWHQEPVLIPADVADLEHEGNLLIGLSEIRQYLLDAPFKEQIFLIDACRDFALENHRPPIGSPVGAYSQSGDPDAEIAEERPRQYMLYSVAPGKRALETGKGIWTQTLLEGLDSRRLSYQVSEKVAGPDGRLRWEIRLDAMSKWLRGRVAQRLARIPKSAQHVQKPEYEPDPRGEDPLLAAFALNEAPRAHVEVFVDPEVAHQSCEVAVLEYDGLGERRVTAARRMPFPAIFSLLPNYYLFLAEARDYTLVEKAWSVGDEPLIELKLERAPAPPPLTRGGPLPESYAVHQGTGWDDPVRSPGGTSFGLPLAVDPDPPRSSRGRAGGEDRSRPTRGPAPGGAPRPGRLTVSFADSLAHVELLGGDEPLVGVGGLPPQVLKPGIYQLRVRLPGLPPVERSIEVRAGSDETLRLKAPAPQLNAQTLELLRALGMVWELEEVLLPSETLGPVAGARLVSLLAFATYAAQQVGPGLEKLRGFGVGRLGGEGLIVLVGSATDAGEELESFLESARISVRRPGGESVDGGGFSRLAGMPAAAQRLTPVDGPGRLVAELRLEGFAPTSYAVAALPGRISILIAVAEADGSVEVQQYLLPVSGIPPVVPPGREYLGSVRDLRRLELAQSFYAAGQREQALAAARREEESTDELLRAKWLDPLLGCLASYVLAGSGRAEELFDPHSDVFEVLADPEGEAADAARLRGPDRSALRNLVTFFPELPDVHVLAGLCDPVEERRSGHFERALRRGLPIFAEGARALAAWARRQGVVLPLELTVPLAGLLPGSPWTAWESGETEEEPSPP